MTDTIAFDKAFPSPRWKKSSNPFTDLTGPSRHPVLHWLATECLWVSISRFAHRMPGRTPTGVVRQVTGETGGRPALAPMLARAGADDLLELSLRSPTPFRVQEDERDNLKALFLPMRTPTGGRRTVVIIEQAQTDTHAGHVWVMPDRANGAVRAGGAALASMTVRSHLGAREYMKVRRLYHTAIMEATRDRPINADHLLSHHLLADGSVVTPVSRDPGRRGGDSVAPRVNFFRFIEITPSADLRAVAAKLSGRRDQHSLA